MNRDWRRAMASKARAMIKHAAAAPKSSSKGAATRAVLETITDASSITARKSEENRRLGLAVWSDLMADGCDFTQSEMLRLICQWVGVDGRLLLLDFDVSFAHTLILLGQWAHFGLPLVDVPFHKYAAALAATDVPVDARFPWPAFAVRIPAGLVQTEDAGRPGAPLRDVTDLYCGLLESENGRMFSFYGHPPRGDATIGARFLLSNLQSVARAESMFPQLDDDYDHISEIQRAGIYERRTAVLVRVIVNALAALENVPAFDREREHRPHTHRAPHGDPSTRRFIVGRPIAVDVRAAVRGWARGEARELRPLQWMVRGHWRNQAAGPGRSAHVRLWIEPHWARRTGAPDDAPIHVRSHVLKGGER